MLIDFLKSSSREFQSQMEDGIHTFCEILVLLKGTDIFLLFLRGYFETSLTKGGIKYYILSQAVNSMRIKCE